MQRKLTILILTTLIQCARSGQTEEISFKTFENEPGIYFETDKEATFFRSEYTLITKLDLKLLYRKLESVQKYAIMTKILCGRVEEAMKEVRCQGLQVMVDTLIGNIRSKESLIEQLIGHRQKRGLINAIGSLSKILFGTLDETDAEQYQKQIKQLEESQEKIIELNGKQIQIFNSSLYKLSNEIKQLEKNEAILEKSTKEIRLNLNEFETNQQKVNLLNLAKEDLNEHIAVFALILQDLNEEINEILACLTQIKLGKICLTLITPNELITQLKLALPRLKEFKFPLEIRNENAHKIIDLAEMTAYISNNRELILINKIPLIEGEMFTSYKMYSVPAKIMDQNYAFIKLSGDYLIIDKTGQNYMIMKEFEWKNCKSLGNQGNICKQEKEFNLIHTAGNCESQFLANPEKGKLAELCENSVNIFNLKSSYFQKLREVNAWIVVTPGQEIVNLNCKARSEKHNFILKGSGILRLKEGCEITNRNKIIKTEYKPDPIEREYKIPMFNLTDIIDNKERKVEDIVKVIEINGQTIGKIDKYLPDGELEDVGKEWKELENQVKNYKYSSSVAKHITVIAIVITIISIIVLVYSIYKIYKKYKLVTMLVNKKKKEPTETLQELEV